MKKIVIVVILGLVLALSLGFYLFNQKPMDTRSVKATFELSADQLIKEFSDDEAAANKKYVDQVIIVSGNVGDIKFNETEASVSLQSPDPMSGVTCSFYSNEIKTVKNLIAGASVKIKGKCTGKLSDVVLNTCSLVE